MNLISVSDVNVFKVTSPNCGFLFDNVDKTHTMLSQITIPQEFVIEFSFRKPQTNEVKIVDEPLSESVLQTPEEMIDKKISQKFLPVENDLFWKITVNSNISYLDLVRKMAEQIGDKLAPVNDKSRWLEIHINWDSWNMFLLINRGHIFKKTRQKEYDLDSMSIQSKHRLIKLLYGYRWSFVFEEFEGAAHYYSVALPRVHSELTRLAKNIYSVIGISDTMNQRVGLFAIMDFYKKHPNYLSNLNKEEILDYVRLAQPGSNNHIREVALRLLEILPETMLIESVNLVCLEIEKQLASFKNIAHRNKPVDKPVETSAEKPVDKSLAKPVDKLPEKLPEIVTIVETKKVLITELIL